MTKLFSIIFLRTSMLFIEYDGYYALTDFWFGMNMCGLFVFRKPGIALSDIFYLMVIIASHLHCDHFDCSVVAEFVYLDV